MSGWLFLEVRLQTSTKRLRDGTDVVFKKACAFQQPKGCKYLEAGFLRKLLNYFYLLKMFAFVKSLIFPFVNSSTHMYVNVSIYKDQIPVNFVPFESEF